MPSRLASVAAVALALSALVAAPGSANAGRKPEDVFAAKILTSRAKYPTTAKSASAYVKQLRKQSTENFFENKETKTWKVYYAAFFKQPLNDIEVTVKIFDITDGSRHLIESFEQYLEKRGERVVISYFTVGRERFGVNRKLMVTMENRNRVLASGRFKILGEAEKYTGEVTFTEEELSKPEQ